MNSPEFQVLGAGGGNHLAFLALGVMCCTMSSASSLPRQHAAVHTLWEQGRIEEAREKALWINNLLSKLPPRRNTEASAEEKAVLEILGICERWVYPPFNALGDDGMAHVKAVLDAQGLVLTTNGRTR